MRFRLIPIFALLPLAPPVHASKPITIAQLEQILRTDRRMTDSQVSDALAGLRLTERVTPERLSAWQAQFTGLQTKDMLLLLADEAAFQPLPAAALSSDPPPIASVREKTFDAALDYANRTIHNLPNLLATRQTLHFQASLDAVMEQVHEVLEQDSNAAGPNTHYVGMNLPLYFTGQFSASVTYRDGKEVPTDQVNVPQNLGLTTNGEFGPVLSIVLGDVQHSSKVWGYWQQHGETRLAVFRYQVPAKKSNYLVKTDDGSLRLWRPAYHGEIVVDPGTGSILRISIVSEPSMLFEPATAILVEYGPVTLGSRVYMVPLHGVALITAAVRPSLHQGSATVTPVQTCLNDVTFSRYRLFRADTRVLSAEESQHLRDNAPAGPAPAPPHQ